MGVTMVIDRLMHGAGFIEDKLRRDKTPDSFDRVFRTKVRAAANLTQHTFGDDLPFCVFFASIASRYGNRGQADYAAANEILGKLAADLDRVHPAHVFSVTWGRNQKLCLNTFFNERSVICLRRCRKALTIQRFSQSWAKRILTAIT